MKGASWSEKLKHVHDLLGSGCQTVHLAPSVSVHFVALLICLHTFKYFIPPCDPWMTLHCKNHSKSVFFVLRCMGTFNLNDFCALNYTMHFISAGFFSSSDSCSLSRQLIGFRAHWSAVCIYFIIQVGLIRSVTDPCWAEAFCPWCDAGEFSLSAPPCGWEAWDRWTRRGCPRIPCLCKGSVAEDFPDSLSAAQTQLSLEIWQETKHWFWYVLALMAVSL